MASGLALYRFKVAVTPEIELQAIAFNSIFVNKFDWTNDIGYQCRHTQVKTQLQTTMMRMNQREREREDAGDRGEERRESTL